MKSGHFFLKAFLFLSLFPSILLAQNNNAPSSKDPHEIKITGYLQTQYQKANAEGITSFSGGDFAANSSERFMIRRGRLKIDRVDKYTNIVFQLDATQNGINLMDAFIQLHEPDKHALTFTAGLFNRPFGYSVVYSSGYRDFPERARVFQTIMPRERDIGAMLSYNPEKIAKFLTADIAVVNGSGLTARDYDSKKDFIGNLNFKFDSLANKKLNIGFGGSFYKGTVRNNTNSVFNSKNNGFIENNSPNNKGANIKRNYLGANFQIQLDYFLGITSLKSEYVAGTQPGVNSATINGPTSSTSFSNQPLTDLYLRKFEGYYFWLSHQIKNTSLTALLSYDTYDPNTQINGDFIGISGNNTSAGDIKYNTFGYGMVYNLTKQIKFTVYNEHVKNETTKLAFFNKDVKDDIFTLRLQYRW